MVLRYLIDSQYLGLQVGGECDSILEQIKCHQWGLTTQAFIHHRTIWEHSRIKIPDSIFLNI
jgi:hypothetical protein